MCGGFGIGSLFSILGSVISLFGGMGGGPQAPQIAAPPPPPPPAPPPPAPAPPVEEAGIKTATQVNLELAKSQAADRRRREQYKSLTVLNSTGESAPSDNSTTLTGQ